MSSNAAHPSLQIGSLTIGADRPKIIVPIVGTHADQVMSAAALIAANPAVDMVEWRIDHHDPLDGSPGATQAQAMDREVVARLAARLAALSEALRAVLAGKPLLATFRTAEEGGARSILPAHYADLYNALIDAGGVDAIDLQMDIGDEVVRQLVDAAHAADIVVFMSYHDFDKTPSDSDMTARLTRQQAMGADVLKLAAMPRSPEDVLRLMAVTARLHDGGVQRPLLTMSMGALGVLSRVCGGLTGSCLTYGKIGSSSAPGQLDADDLARIVQTLHDAVD